MSFFSHSRVAAHSQWRPRSYLIRSWLISFLLLALIAAGYRLYQQRTVAHEQLAQEAVEQEFEQRLERVIELKFAAAPTLEEWLQEWSRQCEIPVAIHPPQRAYYGPQAAPLLLPPMTAREAMQLLVRVKESSWTPQPDGSVVYYPVEIDAPYELRTYPLPDVAVNEYASILHNMRSNWFSGNRSLVISPSALHIVQQHHIHLQIEVILKNLVHAERQIRVNSTAFHTDERAFQPILIDCEEPASAKVLALLSQPVSLSVAEMRLEEFTWQLSQRIQFPVTVDQELIRQHDWPVNARTSITCDAQNVPLGDLIPRLTPDDYLRIVPVAGGRALMIVPNYYERSTASSLTMAYPAAYELSRQTKGSDQDLENLIMNLTGNDNWAEMNLGRHLGGGRFGDALVVTHSTKTHREIGRLLAAMRKAAMNPEPLTDTADVALPQPMALLQQPAELVYFDVPLKDIVADLQQRFQLPLQLSKKIDDVAVAPETPLWCHLPKQPLGENLERLLNAYQLTLLVKRDAIQIVAIADGILSTDDMPFQFEVYNLRAFADPGRDVPRTIERLLLDFSNEFDWQRSGGEGRAVTFGELLIFKQRSAPLQHIRPALKVLQEQLVLSPQQVSAEAVATHSAPVLTQELMAGNLANRTLATELQRRLEARDSIEMLDVKVRDVLIPLLRKHQLPMVFPGSYNVSIDLDQHVSIRASDEPVQAILQRLLPADSTVRWLLAGGQLQTWEPQFEVGPPELFLFNVADLLQPAGKLLPGQLARTIDQRLLSGPKTHSDRQLALYLGKFLGAKGRLDECVTIQRALHDLRTGQLQPLPVTPQDADEDLSAVTRPEQEQP